MYACAFSSHADAVEYALYLVGTIWRPSTPPKVRKRGGRWQVQWLPPQPTYNALP